MTVAGNMDSSEDENRWAFLVFVCTTEQRLGPEKKLLHHTHARAIVHDCQLKRRERNVRI